MGTGHKNITGHIQITTNCTRTSAERKTERDIHIANIAWDSYIEDLYDVLHRASNGALKELRIFTNSGNRTYAFATMSSSASAAEAVKTIDRMKHNGRELVCHLAVPCKDVPDTYLFAPEAEVLSRCLGQGRRGDARGWRIHLRSETCCIRVKPFACVH